MKPNRIIRISDIKNSDFQIFNDMGLAPYFFQKTPELSLIELTMKNYSKISDEKKVYLLSSSEYNDISTYITNVNNLNDSYREQINFLKLMAPSILTDKIMKK
jgi:hypothetical protein